MCAITPGDRSSTYTLVRLLGRETSHYVEGLGSSQLLFIYFFVKLRSVEAPSSQSPLVFCVTQQSGVLGLSRQLLLRKPASLPLYCAKSTASLRYGFFQHSNGGAHTSAQTVRSVQHGIVLRCAKRGGLREEGVERNWFARPLNISVQQHHVVWENQWHSLAARH